MLPLRIIRSTATSPTASRDKAEGIFLAWSRWDDLMQGLEQSISGHGFARPGRAIGFSSPAIHVISIFPCGKGNDLRGRGAKEPATPATSLEQGARISPVTPRLLECVFRWAKNVDSPIRICRFFPAMAADKPSCLSFCGPLTTLRPRGSKGKFPAASTNCMDIHSIAPWK